MFKALVLIGGRVSACVSVRLVPGIISTAVCSGRVSRARKWRNVHAIVAVLFYFAFFFVGAQALVLAEGLDGVFF